LPQATDKEPLAIEVHTGTAFPCGQSSLCLSRPEILACRFAEIYGALLFGRYGGHSEDRAFGVDEVGFLGRPIARWSANLAPEQRRCPSDLSTGSILIYPEKLSERFSGRDKAST
jgi:hypothetical protein